MRSLNRYRVAPPDLYKRDKKLNNPDFGPASRLSPVPCPLSPLSPPVPNPSQRQTKNPLLLPLGVHAGYRLCTNPSDPNFP
jgi:hypothetical protein